MHRLEQMKETLMNCVQTEINGHLDQADAKELGEAVDMIKDLSEAIYYCTITEAMKKTEKEGEKGQGHQQSMMYYPVMYMTDGGGNSGNGGNGNGGGNTGNSRYYPDIIDRNFGRRYYGNSSYSDYRMHDEGFRPLSDSDRSAVNYPNGNMMQNREMMQRQQKDQREGKSPERRRMYMEGKEMHHDKAKQMKELEEYMQELTHDIVEMIQDASPEEKQILQQKLNVLSAKVK